MKIATLIGAAALAACAVAEEPAAKAASAEASAPKASAPERVAARPGRFEPGAMRNPGMMMQDPLLRALANPHIAERLALTPEQKAKLGDPAALRARNRELQEKVRRAVLRQMELMRAEPADEAAVMAAIDEAFEARKEFAKEQAKRQLLVKSVLTPEQMKLLREGRRGARRPDATPKAAKPDAGKSDAGKPAAAK